MCALWFSFARQVTADRKLPSHSSDSPTTAEFAGEQTPDKRMKGRLKCLPFGTISSPFVGRSPHAFGVVQPDQPPDLAIRNLMSLLFRFLENPTGGAGCKPATPYIRLLVLNNSPLIALCSRF